MRIPRKDIKKFKLTKSEKEKFKLGINLLNGTFLFDGKYLTLVDNSDDVIYTLNVQDKEYAKELNTLV